jgi:hypothetical protein
MVSFGPASGVLGRSLPGKEGHFPFVRTSLVVSLLRPLGLPFLYRLYQRTLAKPKHLRHHPTGFREHIKWVGASENVLGFSVVCFA